MIRTTRQIIKRIAIATSTLALTLTMTLGGAAPTAFASGDMEGGFTQTYGWDQPFNKFVKTHYSVATPEMRGVGVFRWPDGDFVRTGIILNGALPSYEFKYVSTEEAAGCSNSQPEGDVFLSLSVYGVTVSEEGGIPPVGEVLPIYDGSLVSVTLVCVENGVATWILGLTDHADIRAGELSELDPENNEISIVAIDVRD